jgi:hypothetical protein
VTGCKWCGLDASEAQAIVLEAARAGRRHTLGAQCWRCRERAWGMKGLNLAIRAIEAERQAVVVA